MIRDIDRWVAGQLASNEGTRLIHHEPGLVLGAMPTAVGEVGVVYEQFPKGRATLRAHVARSPMGSPEEMVAYHDRMNEYRTSIHERRIDRYGDDIYYGIDFQLRDRPAEDQQIVAEVFGAIQHEVPIVKMDYLNITRGMRAIGTD